MALRGPRPKYFAGPHYTYSTKLEDPLICLKSIVSESCHLFYARDSKLASYRRMFTSRRCRILYNLCISISINFLFFSLLSAGPLKVLGPRPWPSWPVP